MPAGKVHGLVEASREPPATGERGRRQQVGDVISPAGADRDRRRVAPWGEPVGLRQHRGGEVALMGGYRLARRAERMSGHHEDLVGRPEHRVGSVGNERSDRLRQVLVGHRQSGPPGAEQDGRGLPAGAHADVHQVAAGTAQFVQEQAGHLRRPVRQRRRGQFGAKAARVGGQSWTVRVARSNGPAGQT